MNKPVTIGEQIRTLRTLRRLSQQQLANLTGLSQFIISFIETDRALPMPVQLDAIKAALNWPDDDQVEAAFALLAGDNGGGQPDEERKANDGTDNSGDEGGLAEAASAVGGGPGEGVAGMSRAAEGHQGR